MSKYRFTSAERYAIFLTHGMKCYLCGTPLDLNSMAVDHVVPEHLLATPAEFEAAKLALGLPNSFDLNSFENWMPACGACNGKKSGLQFHPSLLVQLALQNAAAKAEKGRRTCEDVVSQRQVSMALTALERMQESGQGFDIKTRDRLLALVRFASERGLVPTGQPLRLTDTIRLIPTTVEDASSWGVTHWSMPPREPGEPTLVVLFQAEQGECVECGLNDRVFQPINQDGGGDPICAFCLAKLDWMPPVGLGELPTHVTYA
jgi:hypothetical protein